MPWKPVKNYIVSTHCTEFPSQSLRKQPAQGTNVLRVHGAATGEIHVNAFLVWPAEG